MNSVQATLQAVNKQQPFKLVLKQLSSLFPNFAAQTQLNVLTTDYVNYGLLYSCQVSGNIKTESVWVLSRAKTVKNNTITYLNNFLKTNNINLTISNIPTC